MKALAFVVFLFLLSTSSSQQKFNKIITGQLRPEVFNSDKELKKWFTAAYASYKPDETSTKLLAEKLKGKKIVVILGTWCSDTQRELPKLMKVLNQAGFKNVVLYGVNRKKVLPKQIMDKLKIDAVPTIIVLDENGKELGRIVETVKVSTEKDLNEILK